MRFSFREWMDPPRFDDEIKTWKAIYLYVQVMAVFCVALIVVPIFILFFPFSWKNVIPVVSLLPVFFFTLFLIRHGRIVPASFIVLGMGTAAILFAMITGNGIYDRNYNFFVLLVFSAGLLLGIRGALAFAGIGIAIGVALILGLPSTPLVANADSAWSSMVQQAVIMAIVAVIIGVLSRNMTGALIKVRREAEERIGATEALRKSEERMSAVFHAAHDLAFVFVDGIGRQIIEFSPGAENVFGYSKSEILGLSYSALIAGSGNDRPVGLTTMLETGKPEVAGEGFFLRKNGELFPGFYSLYPLSGPKGVADTVLMVIIDQSDRHRATEERRRFELQVQRTQKLESLGVLAGGIAHDFNNLLVAILGNASLALSELPNESRVRRNVEEIENASTKAAELCRQMLAYSGRGRFVVEPIDLSRAVREMVHILEVSVSKNATLRYDLADDLPPVDADVTQIGQVVMNLIINASEAIGERAGVIRVKTSVTDCDATSFKSGFPAESLPPGRYVSLEVRDTGVGMDADTLSKMFDPFFTTKFTGRGLGLAAVLGIVRGHRGCLKVDSEPGVGSTFRMLLPVSGGSLKALGPEKRKSDVAWKGEGRVLVADDDASVRELAQAMLARLGFEVDEAVDGSDAVRRFTENAGAYVCVLLDLTMPRMGGEEAFHRIKALDPFARVIMSSGYDEGGVVERFHGQGIAGFVQKPYSLSALTEVLKAALE